MLMDRAMAANYLGISIRTLDRRTREGKIAYVSDRPGARVHYQSSELDKYIKRSTHRHSKEVYYG